MRFPKSEFSLMGRLFSYSIREKPSIIFITALGVVSTLVELLAVTSIVPLAILSGGQPLTENSTWSKIPAALHLQADGKFFLVLFLALMLLRMVTFTATQVLNARVMQDLFAHFASHAHGAFVHNLHFRDIIKHQIGHFFTLAGDESNRGAQIVVGIMKLIPVLVLFTAYVALLLYQSWQTGLAIMAILSLIILSLRRAFKKSLALGLRQQNEAREVNTHFFESLGGLRTVRGFTAEEFVTSRYEKLIHAYCRTSFLNDALSQLTQLPAMAVIALALGAVVFYADGAWVSHNMPLMLASIMMFTRLLPVANQGLEGALKLTSNLKAGTHVSEMLDVVRAAHKHERLPDFPNEHITEIKFDGVSFKYSSDTDAPLILDDFSCRLSAGTSYAIVGPSGTGKSSLIDLLLKFYEPGSGSIRINGRDIASISSESLRRHIILAEQATRVYFGTVLENVVMGNPGVAPQAQTALQLVGLSEFLATLPDGHDTVLTFQGSNFSGGQRQRVGVARALARAADVLILDESLNALDANTRERILDAVLSAYRDRIVIFITHDPHVMNRVDRVISLSGSPEALS